MIRRSPRFQDIRQLADFGNKLRFKIAPLIGVQLFRRGKSEEELICGLLCNGGGLLVFYCVGFCPPGEVVCDDQDIAISQIGLGEGTQYIHGDQLQWVSCLHAY